MTSNFACQGIQNSTHVVYLGNAIAMDRLVKDFPSPCAVKRDPCHWFWGSLALLRWDAPSGPPRKKWRDPLEKALLSTQNGSATGEKAGSWEPDSRWAEEGGRVFVTALNAWTLRLREGREGLLEPHRK